MLSLYEPSLSVELRAMILALPTLEVTADYWSRAGQMRSMLLARRLKARVGDALIAQSCLDHGVALLTRDRDFRHFARYCGVRLVVE